jgi:hypothetical protein
MAPIPSNDTGTEIFAGDSKEETAMKSDSDVVRTNGNRDEKGADIEGHPRTVAGWKWGLAMTA